MANAIETRRSVIKGAAAVVAATASVPALAASDPIFALIEQHRAAAKADCDACTATRAAEVATGFVGLPDDHPSLVAHGELVEAEKDAIYELLTTQPTTLAGCLAVLEYVGQNRFGNDKDQISMLADASAFEEDELKDAAWNFLPNIAKTIGALAGGKAHG